MDVLVEQAIEKFKNTGALQISSELQRLPTPAINKVELYLTFYGNDSCAHCITNSGPHRKETLSPQDANRIINNIASHSVLEQLRKINGQGTYIFERPKRCRKLDSISEPPQKLTERLKQDYAHCLMGKDYTSQWISRTHTTNLNFGRPSIRLSGGEFYTWPYQLENVTLTEEERLVHQKELLEKIRTTLPDYDIFILTNGRFAESDIKTLRIINHWSGRKKKTGARTKICLSVDAFHRPPKGSTIEQMLKRVWTACKQNGLGAPFLYGVTNNRIALLGRALESFSCYKQSKPVIKNVSGSTFNPFGEILIDPVNLVDNGGCTELKGFFCQTKSGTMLVNNIVIKPSGHLAYCCVCVGDFGDFLNEPKISLRRILTDPVAMMLRQKQTVIDLLNNAVALDPSIELFGHGKHAAVTGSTCYQLLSGKRLDSH